MKRKEKVKFYTRKKLQVEWAVPEALAPHAKEHNSRDVFCYFLKIFKNIYFYLATLDLSGNPLQCSCLENPRDRGAWWAAIYEVVQSQIRLRRLRSSSSNKINWKLKFYILNTNASSAKEK